MIVLRSEIAFEAADEAELQLAFQPVVEVRNSSVTLWQAQVTDAEGQSFEHLLGTRPLNQRAALLRQRTRAILRGAMEASFIDSKAQVAVPLHAVSGTAERVVSDLLQTALIHGIPATRLVAEISADELGHLDAVIELGQACARRGVAVALNGFTAGPVGMKLLAACRPAYLRLAPALLRTSASRTHMIASILRLCRSMDARVIAPEIRRAAQAAELYDEGVALMQGEWIAPARPVALPTRQADDRAVRREPRPGIAGLTRLDIAPMHRRLTRHLRAAQGGAAPQAH